MSGRVVILGGTFTSGRRTVHFYNRGLISTNYISSSCIRTVIRHSQVLSICVKGFVTVPRNASTTGRRIGGSNVYIIRIPSKISFNSRRRRGITAILFNVTKIKSSRLRLVRGVTLCYDSMSGIIALTSTLAGSRVANDLTVT